ncbi:hypothetical protein Scep_023508 [Stephania cephalantha]|uniref:Uncharacterized protein n=1 Tax=Stephania cephalantha TaxID=152367 RepID=A0AAP0HSU9_9MAGN
MYKLHKENPEVYTVERLAKDYRIMRQRLHAILWLKEIEVEEEIKLGHALDDSIELLLDTCPEFLNAHDREFHVASLPYKPDFRVMPEGWDGTTRDPDEVHYEISMKEDEMLYQEFVQRMNFNKMKMVGEVKCHKYSRRRSSEGWNFTVEKINPNAYRLKLSSHIRTADVFNVKHLVPYYGDTSDDDNSRANSVHLGENDEVQELACKFLEKYDGKMTG